MSTAIDQLEPDARAQRLMVAIAVLVSLLLLLAKRALDAEAAWFSAPLLRTLWFTLAIFPPLLFALVVQRAEERRLWLALLGYGLMLLGLGYYSGGALSPGVIEPSAVLLPYFAVVALTLPVIAAHLAVWLLGGPITYPLLFESSWRQASAALQAVAFTGAFWMLLGLWGALFKAIGITFFAELFREDYFGFPATGLVLGLGLVIARSVGALSDTVHLRILALWRGLLPLVCLLALSFAATLPFTGVKPLWATRNATALLLSLIFVLVFFSNAAFGKGGETLPALWRRCLHEAALLLLPVFAALAAWALSLRIGQYGISHDRLWAGFAVAVASLYALGYAAAVLPSRNGWLALIAPVNRGVACLAALTALCTQTGLMDFRAITAHALRARAATLKPADLVYLRWNLGATGVRALEVVQRSHPSAFGAKLLASKGSSEAYQQLKEAERGAEAQVPLQLAGGTGAAPSQLLALITSAPEDFYPRLAERWLLAVELSGQPPLEWVQIRLAPLPEQGCANGDATLYQVCPAGYCRVGESHFCLDSQARLKLVQALREGKAAVRAPAYADLELGGKRIPLSEIRPLAAP